MLTQQNILKYLTEHKQEFQEKYNIESIGLFGSYARDEANMASDIDIVVSLQKTTLSALVGIKEDIELYFKTSVDIIQLRLTPRHPSKNMLNLQKSKENNGTYRRIKKSI